MAGNLLKELAVRPVPPLPANFRQKIHRHLNHYLVVGHVLELALWVLPYAFGQFLQALGGSLQFSLTGKWPQARVTPPCPPDTNL